MFGKCLDSEGNSLTPDYLHCIVTDDKEFHGESIYEDAREEFLKENQIWVCHNIVRFDVPVLERLCDFTFPKSTLFVDTLAISWYLFPERKKHGLAEWGEIFGVPKPKIDVWEGLSLQEYLHRCKEDVKIKRLLWEKQYKYIKEIYG